MKISQFENEKALDLLADLIDPISRIMTDPEVVNVSRAGTKIEIVRTTLKKHPSDVIEILARLDGVDPKDYKANIIKMTRDLLEMLNDDEVVGLKDFFTSQGMKNAEISSIPVMETTKGKEK